MRRNHWFISLVLCDVLLYPFLLATSSGRDGKMRSWNWDYFHRPCSVVISFWDGLRLEKKYTCPWRELSLFPALLFLGGGVSLK